jgi:hypothetical protein
MKNNLFKISSFNIYEKHWALADGPRPISLRSRAEVTKARPRAKRRNLPRISQPTPPSSNRTRPGPAQTTPKGLRFLNRVPGLFLRIFIQVNVLLKRKGYKLDSQLGDFRPFRQQERRQFSDQREGYIADDPHNRKVHHLTISSAL